MQYSNLRRLMLARCLGRHLNASGPPNLLFFFKNSDDSWMPLSIHPVASSISDSFLTEQHSCNCNVYFGVLPHQSLNVFLIPSPFLYRWQCYSPQACPCVFSCRTLASLNAHYVCTFLFSQARMLLLPSASTGFCVWVFPWWSSTLWPSTTAF